MKVKIFENAVGNDLEKEINDWLKDKEIEIKFIIQSARYEYLVISIFYSEK